MTSRIEVLMTSPRLQYPILLSILAALLTLGLKYAAYALTGSVGMLSDAMEAIINLLASVTAFLSLLYAAKPVDADHTYGHEKIEFFSSGLEGMLIIVAAIGIGWYAVGRLLVPRELEAIEVGMVVSGLATVVNLVVGLLLLRVGKAHDSIVLEADGQHLLTDVWTSLAVLVSVGLVRFTGVAAIDPVIALIVAASIAWTGIGLVRRSFNGLMDHALSEEEQERARKAIGAHLGAGMDFHALRTRRAGSRRFADFHLLVPGALTVQAAHDVTERIEEALKACLPGLEVTVHIEPIEEQSAYNDSALLPVEEAARQAQHKNTGGAA